jgi:hypothetical protein
MSHKKAQRKIATKGTKGTKEEKQKSAAGR